MEGPHSFSQNYKGSTKKRLQFEEYLEGIKQCDKSILGRAITLIESTKTEHIALANRIVEACIPLSGKSIRIGITGVPGIKKSTFIEAFGTHLISKQNRKVAVLAVDPSSQRGRGSILGDKTRMYELSKNATAFIRPSPSSGALGGVARATRAAIILCEAAGFDTLLIETVGVGQSETEIHSMVDFFLLLMLAGAGDELQGIKRGIMELADLLVINKADGDNLTPAKKARATYKNALHLFPAKDSGWEAKVMLCSALEKTGIEAIWQEIEHYAEQTSANGYFERHRNLQSIQWMNQAIEKRLVNHFKADPAVNALMNTLEIKVRNGEVSPFKAAEELLQAYKGEKG